jgi:hypothetical protein
MVVVDHATCLGLGNLDHHHAGQADEPTRRAGSVGSD